MTNDEKQPTCCLDQRATHIPQSRAALRDATERLGPRGHEACLHGKSELLPTEYCIDQTGHSRTMTVVQPIEVPRGPVLQHPAPLAIDKSTLLYSIFDTSPSPQL